MTREEFIGLMAEGRARDMEREAEQAHRQRIVETARACIVHRKFDRDERFEYIIESCFEKAEQFEAAAREYLQKEEK